MDEPPDASCFLSETFVFVVGPAAQEVTIHKAVFLRLSPYFRRLITGDMEEARHSRAVWDDIEVAVFSRLCEFAYTINYREPRTPSTTTLLHQSRNEGIDMSAMSRGDAACVLDWHHAAEMRLAPGGPKNYQAVKAFFKDAVEFGRLDALAAVSGVPSYLDNLLCNGQMYVLGDRYGIDELLRISMEKLHWTLETFPCRRDRFGEFAELVAYVTPNTRVNDPLRRMLALWTACVVPVLVKEVERLLEEVPEFAVEVYRELRTYIR